MTAVLRQKPVAEYVQGVQALRQNLDAILNPYLAALLATVFQPGQDEPARGRIRAWLVETLEPILASELRSRDDLPEVCMAIAAYLYLEDTEEEPALPGKRLSEYLEYAHQQNWFDQPTVAFLAALSADEYVACAAARDYLEENLARFVAQDRIEAVCQALYVQMGLDDEAVLNGIAAISDHLGGRYMNDRIIPWTLLVASQYPEDLDTAAVVRLREYLYREVQRSASQVLNQPWDGADQTDEDEEDEPEWGTDEMGPALPWNQTPGELSLAAAVDPRTGINWETLGVQVACLCLSANTTALIVDGLSEGELNQLLAERRKADAGGVLVSKSAVWAGNIVVLLVMLYLGGLLFADAFGFSLEPGASQVSADPTFGHILLSLVWLYYLLAMIGAMGRGESVFEVLASLPFTRPLLGSRVE